MFIYHKGVVWFVSIFKPTKYLRNHYYLIIMKITYTDRAYNMIKGGAPEKEANDCLSPCTLKPISLRIQSASKKSNRMRLEFLKSSCNLVLNPQKTPRSPPQTARPQMKDAISVRQNYMSPELKQPTSES